ncbi:Salt sensitive [Heracleum sosnowskyi]|uniref:Salt sensitive n=1 Tax=Heracleum sosnowskyi TaxID=360622 RepID=A0AAD8N1A5_9APIA|nr:Salt sensitive [Heracleum sosnowskyi]
MEGGLPMLNCLLQQTLRSLCSFNTDSSRWVYAVFWRILPRNYPPPEWDQGKGSLECAKENKRNWILVWEDGFCDFCECERAAEGYPNGRFGADVYFKMSHEVYNYGEGLIGKVAADNSHKWVFNDTPNVNDPSFTSSWNVSLDLQPRAWDLQFNTGIQTIATISVREGIIQLGSLDKIVEDLNLVISIQRKFSFIQSIPGVYAMQRPYLPIQHPYTFKPNNPHIVTESSDTAFFNDEKHHLSGLKMLQYERQHDQSSNNSTYFSNISQQNGSVRSSPPLWSIPPLLPSTSCNYRALSSKLPSITPYHNATAEFEYKINGDNNESQNVKLHDFGRPTEVQSCRKVEPYYAVEMATHQESTNFLNHNLGLGDVIAVESGFTGPISAFKIL